MSFFSIGQVTHNTTLINLHVSGNHSETIQFLLIKSPQIPRFWDSPVSSDTTHSSTGLQVPSWAGVCSAMPIAEIGATCPGRLPGSSEVVQDLSAIPAEYQDLREVFSKSRATSLLPHCPYDCGIDLLPSTMPPQGRLYSLSGHETKAMEDYIGDSLANGFIRPSSSPTGAGFFFMEKKNKTLHPCIDNQGLK
jgi:hypothetical protein